MDDLYGGIPIEAFPEGFKPLEFKMKVVSPFPEAPADGSDRLLSLQETAVVLGLSQDYFYRRKRLPYEVSIPGSTKRLFSYRAIQDFIRKRLQ